MRLVSPVALFLVTLTQILSLSLWARPAAADEVAFVRGGPKSAADKEAAIAAIAAGHRELLPCWRRSAASVEVAITTGADGLVTSAAARTDGPSAQCVAGLLAVAVLPKVAWSGVVRVSPGTSGTSAPVAGDATTDVGAALGVHAAELRACQKADPRAAGVVEVDLRVRPDGTLTDVAIGKSLSSALDACLLKALARIKLDGYRGKEVHYRLGLQYAGGDGGAPRNGPTPPEPSAPAPTKRGPLEVDQMMPVIEANRVGIDRCGAHVKKSGKLMVRFTIRKDGTVKNLAVVQSVGDTAVEKCVLDRFAGLKFPTASDETQVQFPLVFDAP